MGHRCSHPRHKLPSRRRDKRPASRPDLQAQRSEHGQGGHSPNSTGIGIKGFGPEEIDGEFESATVAAVLAFQRSKGLVEDGEVGPDTAAALGVSRPLR
jgi:murein L,D-transpeptidase YcbB/YkuD